MDGQGFQVPCSTKASRIWFELPQRGPQYFLRKNPGPGGEDVRTREEDDLGKVVCGGTALSMRADSATYIDPHTQSVLFNWSVVLLSVVAEDTEYRIPKSDQCIG